VILFNRFAPGTAACSVSCDNVTGGRAVADMLLNSGHRRIAYIAGRSDTSTNEMRERGFVGRLQERGFSGLLRREGVYTYEAGYAATADLLTADRIPDAIFCAADIMAMGAMDAARARGLRIPQDVAVVGFDDIPGGWLARLCVDDDSAADCRYGGHGRLRHYRLPAAARSNLPPPGQIDPPQLHTAARRRL
jgi:DNA-binding LacI/PurR family transcriptional regulator